MCNLPSQRGQERLVKFGKRCRGRAWYGACDFWIGDESWERSTLRMQFGRLQSYLWRGQSSFWHCWSVWLKYQLIVHPSRCRLTAIENMAAACTFQKLGLSFCLVAPYAMASHLPSSASAKWVICEKTKRVGNGNAWASWWLLTGRRGPSSFQILLLQVQTIFIRWNSLKKENRNLARSKYRSEFELDGLWFAGTDSSHASMTRLQR